MSTVTLSAKYQMVIPEETRRKLALKRGQRLVVFEKGGVIYVLPRRLPKELEGFAPHVREKDLRDKRDRDFG